MLSLDSDQDSDALRRFDDRVRKAMGEDTEVVYLVEPKLDGLSIELVYEDGLLTGYVYVDLAERVAGNDCRPPFGRTVLECVTALWTGSRSGDCRSARNNLD